MKAEFAQGYGRNYEPKHRKLEEFISEIAALCNPERVYVCDGSESEYDRLCEELVASGTFIRLNETKRPRSFLARSTASDVARVEERELLFALREKKMLVPTTTGWRFGEAKSKLRELFRVKHARSNHVCHSL